MIIAKNGKLYIDGKRVGQIVIPTSKWTPKEIVSIPKKITPCEIISSTVIDKEQFIKMIRNNDERLLYYPLLSNSISRFDFFTNKLSNKQIIDFDFIQVQGKLLIWADGDKVEYFGQLDDETLYYLMTRGIIIDSDKSNELITKLEKDKRSSMIFEHRLSYLMDIVEYYGLGDVMVENDEILIISDDDIIKVYEEDGIYFTENIQKVPDEILRGLIINDKIYGLVPNGKIKLVYKNNKLYLDKFEIVSEFSISGNKIKSIDNIYNVRIVHPFKGYKILSFEGDRVIVEYHNGEKIIRKELLELFKTSRKLRVISKEYEKILKHLSNVDIDFTKRGNTYYTIYKNLFITFGNGILELEHILDKKGNIFIKSSGRVFEIFKIDTVEDLYEIDKFIKEDRMKSRQNT